ncbi:MAG TPA: hypothetical protein VF951_06535 [Streptosporangiaceae bacterium]|nr:hypothetical protein [Streptosporangiaceae bacterium]
MHPPLRRLVEFGSWVGDGRPVDRRGELPRDSLRSAAAALGLPADGVGRLRDPPALARLWWLSLDFGMLSLRRTLLEYSPDHAAEHAADLVSECAKLGIELPRAELRDLLPEWSTMLG